LFLIRVAIYTSRKRSSMWTIKWNFKIANSINNGKRYFYYRGSSNGERYGNGIKSEKSQEHQ